MAETWSVEYADDGKFERFFNGLGEYEQAVLVAAVEHVLQPYGIDICQGEWGKALGKGLYEFRIRRSLGTILNEYGQPDDGQRPATFHDRPVLLRVFCTFHGAKIVLLLGGYDKGKHPSPKRQDQEIRRARKQLTKWRNER